MQIYVLNRARETLATTSSIYDDKHTLTLDAGSSSYEFKISKNDEASRYMDSGNYIVLQNDGGKTWLFTILDYEETQYTKTVYAEDAGIELLNKACDIWKANGPHSFEYYFNLVTSGTPWKLGVNQLAGLERTLKYEGRDTGLGRLLSILKGFDNAECTFDVAVKMNAPCAFKINVYKQVGSDRSDVQMVYSHELDNITKKESRAEFVTALCGVGGTVTPPEGQEATEQKNIDFADLEYNKGGLVTTKGDKFLRAVDANKRFNPGQAMYIEAFYEYDTQSASELLNRTITRLKTYSEPQYTYTADVKIIDSTLKIGDTVTIIDHDYNPALYLSARVAKLEKSYTDPAQNTIEFCNYQLLSSRLADKLARLQTIVNKMPSASQVGKLESNVSNLAQKQEELSQEIVSANGKNTNFYGKTEPANPKNGDLWYKKLENGEIEMYQRQDGVWQLLTSTADLTTVQTELDQAKADMAQAKTDAQSAYDEAIKATGTANGAKAQTDEALKQAKQANDSYTALAKEVADNKSSADADYQKAQADITQAQKDLASVTGTVSEFKKGQGELSSKIAGKVDNTVYQTYVKQTNQSLSEKLVSSDLNGYAKTVDVTKSIDGVKTTIADNAGKITTMQTDINGVKTNVKNAQGDITSIKADVSGVKTTVSSNTGKIAQLVTDVNGIKSSVSSKVDKTTYQSYVAQTDKALSAKLTASDLSGYAKTTDLEARAGKIEASLTSVNGKLDGLQIGGTNLLDNSAMESTAMGHNSYDAMSFQNGWTVFTQKKAKQGRNSWYIDMPKGQPEAGNYAVGIDVKLLNCSSGLPTAELMIRRNSDWHAYGSSGEYTLKVGQTVRLCAHAQSVQPTTGSVATILQLCTTGSFIGQIAIRHVKLEKGNKATDWCMSDNDFQSQLNTLSGKITATSDRLSSVYTKSEVDGKLGTKVEQSALTQTSNSLSASIAKNSKILSSIGLTSDTAYINANKIALNGKTLMSNATINDAFIGSLSANKITTGTLNAAKVNLINVNASNISTGTLNGVKITSTGKDPSGTSSTTNIQSGYIDTNVINCSDYILVGKADADPRKRWQTKQDKWGMWFQTPAKLNGHTGNAPSDWQSEWQGFIRGDGWNYETADATGNGASGIAIAITPEQTWGRPYGGDYFQIGVWQPNWGGSSAADVKDFKKGWCSPRFVVDVTGQLTGHPHSITLGDTEDYTGTYNHGNLNILDGNLHVKPVYANHGIRTAWVSWSDWGSNQKIPCIVQDGTNWGGIAFPANGRTVLFTHERRVTVADLPAHGGGYNGWGN